MNRDLPTFVVRIYFEHEGVFRSLHPTAAVMHHPLDNVIATAAYVGPDGAAQVEPHHFASRDLAIAKACVYRFYTLIEVPPGATIRR